MVYTITPLLHCLPSLSNTKSGRSATKNARTQSCRLPKVLTQPLLLSTSKADFVAVQRNPGCIAFLSCLITQLPSPINI
jgi:hypothetical protein